LKDSSIVENSNRILVRDLMKVGVASCAPETLVSEVAHLLREKGIEGIIVLDQEEGHALGMISQNELADAFIRHGADARNLKAEEIMRDNIPQVPPDIPLQAAFQIMRDTGVRIVFLMHHAGGVKYSAAALSFSHLMRYLDAKDDSELTDLGIKADRMSPLDAFIQKRDAARRAASE
jgi:signal-transduction protein with cAMP-binding, CBS, and nucleotidyltransferase domain